MEGIFKVVKSSEVSFRKKKFQNELQHQSRRREMKSSKVEEGLLSRSMLGFQDVQNAKWFYKFFCMLMGIFGCVMIMDHFPYFSTLRNLLQ